MNKVAVVIVSLILTMAVGLSGCVTINLPGAEEPTQPSEEAPEVAPPTAEAPEAPEPAPPVVPPASPPTSSTPSSGQDVSIIDLREQLTVLEWPTEAHIGDYITIRVKTMSDEFWEWFEDELIKAGQWDLLSCIGDDATYELTLTKDWPDVGTYDYSLGMVTPDRDLIVSWYSTIPTTGGWFEYDPDIGQQVWKEGPFPPGSYKLEFRWLDPCDDGTGFCGYDLMLERNIIIKE